MTKSQKPQVGITILEMLLITVIIGSILYAGIQQINGFRMNQEAASVRTHVEEIMGAMRHYYRDQCGGIADDWGTLNPNHVPPPADQFPIDIAADLRDNGYLNSVGESANLNSVFPVNSFIDNSASPAGTLGYVAQFNLSQAPQSVCTEPGCPAASRAESGIIWRWTPQVAIKLKDTKNRVDALKLLQGDCLSTLNGTTVDPCTPTSDGPYVVFSRNPSLPNMYDNPATWTNHWNLIHFTQADKDYPFSYLVETGGKTPSGQPQYYVCGD